MDTKNICDDSTSPAQMNCSVAQQTPTAHINGSVDRPMTPTAYINGSVDRPMTPTAHFNGSVDRPMTPTTHLNGSVDDSIASSNQYLYESVDQSLLLSNDHRPPAATWKYKVFKSLLVSNIFTFMGLSTAIITPSIDDLKNQVGCNYEQFARAFMFGSVGGMAGSLVGGYLADRFQKHVDLLMGIELIIGALARAALPWAPNLATLGALFAVTGCSLASNAHLLVIWGADASSPMQLLHMGYGIGTVVSPLIVESFLGHTTNHTHNKTDDLSHWLAAAQQPIKSPLTYDLDGSSKYDVIQSAANATFTDSRIYIPFTAIACFGIFGGVLFFLFYFIPSSMAQGQRDRVKERKTANQLFNPGQCADGRVIYGIIMIGLLFTIFVFNSGKENSVSTLMYAVAVDTSLSFSTLMGSLLTTGYYIGYAGGRAVYAILGLRVPVQILLFSALIGMLAVHTTLALIGLDAPINFWICICMSGFFAGPVVPSVMTWMDRYIEMTALAFASLSVGMALGGFLFNWLSGYIFQYYKAVYLYYMSLGCGVVIVICVIAGQILGCIHGDRYHKMKRQEMEVEQNGPIETQETYNSEDKIATISDTDNLIQ